MSWVCEKCGTTIDDNEFEQCWKCSHVRGEPIIAEDAASNLSAEVENKAAKPSFFKKVFKIFLCVIGTLLLIGGAAGIINGKPAGAIRVVIGLGILFWAIARGEGNKK